jgi:hypothetical protein
LWRLRPVIGRISDNPDTLVSELGAAIDADVDRVAGRDGADLVGRDGELDEHAA